MRLVGNDGVEENLPRVKDVVVVHVTDLAHGIAHNFVHRNHVLELLTLLQIRDRNFAADDDDVALGVGLAGDAARFILPDAGVEDGVGTGVTNFIRVTFPDGFGREKTTT